VRTARAVSIKLLDGVFFAPLSKSLSRLFRPISGIVAFPIYLFGTYPMNMEVEFVRFGLLFHDYHPLRNTAIWVCLLGDCRCRFEMRVSRCLYGLCVV
jgi:hypothetical protein